MRATTLARYRSATRRAERAMAEIQEATRERCLAVADMHAEGLSYSAIGTLLGVSRARAFQLAEAGRQPAPE